LKVGDLVKIPYGIRHHRSISASIGLIVGRIPREDGLHDWRILMAGSVYDIGHQMKLEVVSGGDK
jgi:hypothetical protein